MKDQSLKENKGFTLIELMVAVTIVILLSAVGITSYRAANQKGRDGKRKSDINQIRSALEMYRSDVGTYPTGVNWDSMISTLSTGNYISTIPQDPRSTDGYAYYYSSATGYTYTICALLESETGSCTGNPDCGTEGTCNYQFNSP